MGKSTAEDLIGDTSKRAKNVTSGKGSGAGAGKGAAAPKGGKGNKAGSVGERSAKATNKKADAKAKANAEEGRSARGEGKYFFPADHADRLKIRKVIEKSVAKGEASTKDVASANDFPTWQVRLVAKEMSREKPPALKLEKSGDTGGVLMMSAPKRK